MISFTLYDVLNIYWLNRVSKVWRPLNESAALVSMLLSPRKSFIKSCSQDCDADCRGSQKDFSRKTASSDGCGTAVLKLLGLDLSRRTGCISLGQIYANHLLMTGTGSNYIK